MGVLVEEVTVGRTFLRVLLFSSIAIIPPWLHTHISFTIGVNLVKKLLPIIIL